MSGPRLGLDLDPAAPLDHCLLGRLELHAGSSPAEVSARLNLVEGDVEIQVSAPDGIVRRCVWPWPVDAQARNVTLAPGDRLVGWVPLIATGSSEPLFAAPGVFGVEAVFIVAPGVELRSETVRITRQRALDADAAAALSRRDVLQSLLSAATLGDAGPALEGLASARSATTRELAALSLDRPLGHGDLAAGELDDALAAVLAVLPTGVYDADPRRVAALDALGVDGPPAVAGDGS